jgi:two-component system, OmpR family, copper resistance phosphate regulon response regulator CusR
MKKVLIVEDEPRLVDALVKGLDAHAFEAEVATDGRSGLALARSRDFALAILDLGLPGIDGLEVLRGLRAAGRTYPVIILSARDEVVDKVAGLEIGADDYLTKPFAIEELIARVRVRLRSSEAPGEALLRAGAVTLDLRTRRATLGDTTVVVTAREFTLLEMFMRHPGVVLSRERVIQRVWGYTHDPGTNVVDVYVRHLRRKLGAEVIETVYGEGYRLPT